MNEEETQNLNEIFRKTLLEDIRRRTPDPFGFNQRLADDVDEFFRNNKAVKFVKEEEEVPIRYIYDKLSDL